MSDKMSELVGAFETAVVGRMLADNPRTEKEYKAARNALRTLLSEAEQREKEARAKALEEAAKVAEDKAQAWSTSKGSEIDACLDTAAAIRALQSEER